MTSVHVRNTRVCDRIINMFVYKIPVKDKLFMLVCMKKVTQIFV